MCTKYLKIFWRLLKNFALIFLHKFILIFNLVFYIFVSTENTAPLYRTFESFVTWLFGNCAKKTKISMHSLIHFFL